MSKRYAICIGINNYKYDPDLKLNYACADAQGLTAVLSDQTRGCFESKLIMDKQATRDGIRHSLSTLLLNPKLRKEDVVLVYFSGHGALDLAENLVLVTHDAKFDYDSDGSPRFDISTGYHIKDFETLIENSKAGTIIFIADACYSGACSRALGRLAYHDNSNIIFVGASSSKQPSIEISSLKHGLFTSCFIEALGLKPTKSQWITLQQLLSAINSKMKLLGSQGLEVSTHFINPDILIAKNPLFEVDNGKLTLEVKDLFEIEGSCIIPIDEEIPNFFIADQSRPLSTNRIGIVCINNLEHEITENDVEQFLQKVENYRNRRQVDRGYLITNNPLNPTLAVRIRNSMVAECYTKEQLLGSIIDFHAYLRRIIGLFTERNPGSREPPLEKFYVDLKASRPNSKKDEYISQVVDQWLKSGSQRLAILGQYGSGKTAFCKKLAHDLARRHLDGTEKRIPILLDLGKFPRLGSEMEDVIINHLIRVCGVKNASFEAFRKLNDSGFLILIFDGLDEMAVRTSKDVLEDNMHQIAKLSTAPENRVIVTCRPEYFWSNVEEDSSFSGYNRTSIAQLTPGQIRLFLRKRVALIPEAKHGWLYYYNSIKSIRPLTDLSRRPIFLEMIAETLPQIIEEDREVNRSSLYDTYLKNEIKRQKIEKNRELMIDVDKRFQIMQILAYELFDKKNTNGLDSSDIVNLVGKALSPEQLLELRHHAADFLICSFLKREGTKFSFSHQTIMEYLVSEELYNRMKNGDFSVLERELSEPILDFLGEKSIDGNILVNRLKSTVEMNGSGSTLLGANTFSLLYRSGYPMTKIDFSRTDIHNASIKNLDLPGVVFDFGNCDHVSLIESNLNEASFESTSLYGADLSKSELCESYFAMANMERANLSNCDLRKADMNNADMTSCSLHGANLEKANLSNSNLANADLQDAKLVGANLYGSNLGNANLAGADMSEADIRDADLTDCILENATLYGVAFNDSTKINAKDFGCSIENALIQGTIDRQLYDFLLGELKWEKALNDSEYRDNYNSQDDTEDWTDSHS